MTEAEKCMSECVQRERELQGVGPQPGFAPRPIDKEISQLCAERCQFSSEPPEQIAQRLEQIKSAGVPESSSKREAIRDRFGSMEAFREQVGASRSGGISPGLIAIAIGAVVLLLSTSN